MCLQTQVSFCLLICLNVRYMRCLTSIIYRRQAHKWSRESCLRIRRSISDGKQTRKAGTPAAHYRKTRIFTPEELITTKYSSTASSKRLKTRHVSSGIRLVGVCVIPSTTTGMSKITRIPSSNDFKRREVP